MSDWADEFNDNYQFYLISESAKRYHSIKELFSYIIIDNIYYQMGGHYFYVSLLSYLGYTYFDGNSIILQYIGTGLSAVIGVIFLFKILASIVDIEKANKYTLLYAILSPFLFVSISIWRDTSIAAFYTILIYLTFCRNYNIIVFLLQILIAFILTYYRLEHALFATIFIFASLVLVNQKSRWVYVLIVLGILVTVGTSLLDETTMTYTETTEHYTNRTNYRVGKLTTGIGRYLFLLPSPIKEVAQIIFSQMRFPPWFEISRSKNTCDVILGIIEMFGIVYWFRVFCMSIFCTIRQKFKAIPTKYIIAVSIFFLMIIACLSEPEMRRFMCVYPLLYMFYIYSKEYIIPPDVLRNFDNKYLAFYGCLCTVYLLISSL